LGRLRPISDLAGIQYVPLDDSPQSHNALANRLRTAGCRLDIPRSGGLPASGLPAADTGLPPVEGDAGAAARVALFRRLRSALPLPGMGGSLELAAEATLGENLVLSLHLPSTAINFRLHHWLPGASLPRRLDLASTEKTSSVVTLALSMRGPAGVHFFDLLTAEEGSRTWQVAARARCVVGER
jgi:hypothetical protein